MTPIEKVTASAESKIRKIAAEVVREEHRVAHYGANDIHPGHLAFWICVKSDAGCDRLNPDSRIMERLRNILIEVDYPEEGRSHVYIGFEYRETVDRDSGGNWWRHWT